MEQLYYAIDVFMDNCHLKWQH